MSTRTMQPLDFVRTKNGDIGMITEVSTTQNHLQASIRWLRGMKETKIAWWEANEFEIIDNLPNLLSQELRHPSGNDSLQPFDMENT